ncbi:hypothetical protein [Bacteriovorax sp. Seq25_V]|uniref:hypothetical protein n=1 Tax=Bacteriovorax sp. Seq25_V TaxID=1201288 RepID=UPI000389DE8A|nr:hypothetical protein [Bacteriovorax sp. Seq25_V]EQC47502.1 hypothetical protein M900_0727 [Bacteriovorax sp. Seq25_V]
MDIEFLNDVKNNSHLFHQGEGEVCPKCDSFAYDSGVCDTCHYDGNKSVLGEPLGEKSFYTMKENFFLSLSRLEREHPKLFLEDNRFKQYINKIKLRYNDLLDYFYSDKSIADNNRALYLQELRDTILELMDFGVEESELWHPLNRRNVENHSLFSRIKDVITEYNLEKASVKKLSLSYKFGGIISIGTILLTLMMVTVLMCLSYTFLTYSKFYN